MTTRADSILVLAATGKTGRRLVSTLRAAGEHVRAASRSGEVRFDWADRGTWPAALDGASAVYLVASENPALTTAFVENAVAAGVRRFVALSGRGIGLVPPEPFRSVVAAEEAVRDSGAQWSVIRPNNFNQNFDEGLWRAPLRAGLLTLPIGPAPEPFIDVQDVADVAAALLTSDGHHGKVYELSGSRALTFAEAVEMMADAAGRPIRYAELTPEEYRAELVAGGAAEDEVEEADAMFAAMRAGHLAEPTDAVRQVLGRAPVEFGDYVARAAAAGAWS
ncbi:NAD(P)H-binding protein [Saccharopolyspora sp. NPDC003752]